MDEPATLKRARSLTTWGFGITAVYVAVMVAYAAAELGDLRRLEGNEFGDLLAGVFSPLAFLWLVLGFFQQGQELRASVEALRLQGQELQNSVEQQRQLVEVTREQLEFQAQALSMEQQELDRVSQPVLEMTPVGNSGSGSPTKRLYAFRVANFGQRATDLRVTDVVQQKDLRRIGLLDTGDHTDFKLELPTQGVEKRFIRVSYVDARGLQRSQSFHLEIAGGLPSCRAEEERE